MWAPEPVMDELPPPAATLADTPSLLARAPPAPPALPAAIPSDPPVHSPAGLKLKYPAVVELGETSSLMLLSSTVGRREDMR